MSNNTNNYLQIQGYHPHLQKQWEKQIQAYKINNKKQIETFIDWDDPYKNFRFWTIIDFLREFKLTK